MSFMLVSGSGPGEPEYYLHVWDTQQRRLRSYRWNDLPRLSHPSASVDGTEVVGVGPVDWSEEIGAVASDPPPSQPATALSFDGHSRSGFTVWMMGLAATTPLNHLAMPREGALYHPRISPTRMSFAWLETPGVGYPPRKGCLGQIRSLDGEHGNYALSPFSVEALLAPFDWGPGGRSLVFTDPRGALCQVQVDDASLVDPIAPRGTLPRYSPDGQALAYYAEKAILVRRGGILKQYPVKSPIVGLCWDLHEPTIWFAEVVGPWRTQISRLDLASKQVVCAFQTGILSGLDAIASLPSWNEFSPPERAAASSAISRRPDAHAELQKGQ